MTSTGYSWMTVHRARFQQGLPASETGFSGPPAAAAWRCGPDAPLGPDGFRSGKSDVWGGVAFYDDRAGAEAALATPAPDLPFADRAAECWHGLVAVIAHRGEVDWSSANEPHPALVPLGKDPGGVMAVITSAGYVSRFATEHARIRDFLAKIEQVRAFYGSLEANVVRQLFNFVGAPDGVTFSIWRDDEGMIAAAYKDGAHRRFMDQHKASALFDRSSFTRLRLLSGCGSWDGRDPLAAAALAPDRHRADAQAAAGSSAHRKSTTSPTVTSST